jgi:hypothetical protein
LYSYPIIITMTKSGRMRLAEHVAQIRTKRNALGYWWESQKERDHQEDQDIGGWIILKWILDRMGWYGLD